MNKLLSTFISEFQSLHLRLVAANIFLAPFPSFVGGRFRRIGLRAAGFDVGDGTLFWGMPTITGTGDITKRLHIGKCCLFNVGCMFDLGDSITIGDNVGVGHQVLIITGSHQIGTSACRAGEVVKSPVVIEDGVWIGSRATILPGVTVGAGAVIGAGTVVNRDVPPDTLISGNQRISLAKWRSNAGPTRSPSKEE